MIQKIAFGLLLITLSTSCVSKKIYTDLEKKYADLNDCADLLEKITLITAKTKVVKEEIYRMLIEDFKYFE
jgi:hypothetical protein